MHIRTENGKFIVNNNTESPIPFPEKDNFVQLDTGERFGNTIPVLDSMSCSKHGTFVCYRYGLFLFLRIAFAGELSASVIHPITFTGKGCDIF